MSDSGPMTCGLVVIARNAFGQIITRITSHRNLIGAIHTAKLVLFLKADAVCVEVHSAESSISDYRGKPLVTIRQDDLPIEQIR